MNTATANTPNTLTPVVVAGDTLRSRNTGITFVVAESFATPDGWTVVNTLNPVGQLTLRYGWTFDYDRIS